MPSRAATTSIATLGTQPLPVWRRICPCTSYSSGITALACRPAG